MLTNGSTEQRNTGDTKAVIDWPTCVGMCDNDPDFTHHMLATLNDSLRNDRFSIAIAYYNKDTNTLCFELKRCLDGVSYLKLPQLEFALKCMLGVISNNRPNNQLADTYHNLQQAIDKFRLIWKTNLMKRTYA
jgi:hypothetical protein